VDLRVYEVCLMAAPLMDQDSRQGEDSGLRASLGASTTTRKWQDAMKLSDHHHDIDRSIS
jgi:hypothetical protein